MSVAQEWEELIASVFAMSDFGDTPAKGCGRQGACQYFVALWTACCGLEKTTACVLPQIVGCCVTHNEPTTLWWASTMSLVGACFVAGIAVDRDTSKAASLFRRASDAGNASAMNSLGVCYKNGCGVDKDLNEAVSLYRRAADAGNIVAMNNLGWCYESGNGVGKDMNEAVSLYRRAADAGSADAMFNLGLCYDTGNGVEKDMNEAVSLFRKAADAGSAYAMFNLGLCYKNGDGVDKDMNEAVSLYRRAADAGCASAMNSLGLCYHNGNGVEKDMNEAVSLFRKAADAGDTDAMFNLGWCYESGDGVYKDMNEAVSLFRKAADAGSASAMNSLGLCYQNGNGVEKDMKKAVSLFRKAADAGNIVAMFNLGWCYQNGNGVEKDMNEAVSLYRKAADAGDSDAMFNLGVCYENGDGVYKDMNEAVSLYRRAADAGNIVAMVNLGSCYHNGNGVDKDMNEAVSLFRKAADAGDTDAMFNLGVCYEYGNDASTEMGDLRRSLHKLGIDGEGLGDLARPVASNNDNRRGGTSSRARGRGFGRGPRGGRGGAKATGKAPAEGAEGGAVGDGAADQAGVPQMEDDKKKRSWGVLMEGVREKDRDERRAARARARGGPAEGAEEGAEGGDGSGGDESESESDDEAVGPAGRRTSRDGRRIGCTRVFIKNLPKHTTSERLRKHLETVAEHITDCKVMYSSSGKSRLFAYAGFKTAHDAKNVIKKLNKTYLDTSLITLERAKPFGDTTLPRPWSRYSVGSSAYLKQHPNLKFTTKKTEHTPANRPTIKPPADVKVADPTTKQLLEKFLKAMAPANGQTWSNEPDAQRVENWGGIGKEEKKEAPESTPEVTTDVSTTTSETSSASTTTTPVTPSAETTATGKRAPPGPADASAPGRKVPRLAGKVAKEVQWDTGRLFIRNLPFTMTEDELTHLCSPYGKVMSVHIPVDIQSKVSKGFAFVRFESLEESLRAYNALDASIVQGRLLHVLPAAPEEKTTKVGDDPKHKVEGSSSAYKREHQKDLENTAGYSFNWNSMFLRQDAVASAMSHKMSMSKSDLLDKAASNLAVRMSLAETNIITETKNYLKENGVNVSSLEQGPRCARSGTTILVKNLPATTEIPELQSMFEKYGGISRVLVPPSKALAVVEYNAPTDARTAFKSLAYTRYHASPLFLEWAPKDIFTLPNEMDAAQAIDSREEPEPEPEKTDATEENEDPNDPSKICTVMVKNLSFETTEDDLFSVFGKYGVVKSAKIAKTSGGDGNEQKSLGFGFVEYADHLFAVEALKQGQGINVDGRSLSLEFARKRIKGGEAAAAASLAKRKETADVPKSPKIIIRNVAFQATEKELTDLVGAIAQVKSVRLPRKFDGSHRGFAFVEFLSTAEASTAVEALKDTHFYGRHLSIEYAKA
ncbi:sel1 repeat family protein [Pelomyxa schiedti]|nr:sel1 repeat family protein [Pelomyxa schiedti]